MEQSVLKAQYICGLTIVSLLMHTQLAGMKTPDSFNTDSCNFIVTTKTLQSSELPNTLTAHDAPPALSTLEDIDRKLELSARHTQFYQSVKNLIENKQVAAQDALGRTRLHYALFLWDLSVIATLICYPSDQKAINIKDKEGDTPLHHLLKRTIILNSEALETLNLVALSILHGAQLDILNQEDESYLHYVVQYQSFTQDSVDVRKKLIKLLVDNGVQVNAKNQFDETPLHYALKSLASIENKSSLRLEMVSTLLELGADPNLADSIHKNSALHNAMENRSLMYYDPLPGMLKLLIERGGDPNKRNGLGFTPLFLLVSKQEPSTQAMRIARLLLQKDANPNLKSRAGYAALHVAICKEELDWVQFLLDQPTTDPLLTHEPHPRTVTPQTCTSRTTLDIARDIQAFNPNAHHDEDEYDGDTEKDNSSNESSESKDSLEQPLSTIDKIIQLLKEKIDERQKN